MKQFSIRHPYWLAIAWTAVIFILCCTPGQYIPSADIFELLKFDKWVHASIFFILQTLFMRGLYLGQKPRWAYALVFLGCVSYGGLLEIMQATLFSQRTADWMDFAANSFGCVMALLLFRSLHRVLWLN